MDTNPRASLAAESESTEPCESDAAWANEELAEASAWRDVFDQLFGGRGKDTYPGRAARLEALGWSPADLRAACTDPRALLSLAPPVGASEAEAVAGAVLAGEANAYYDDFSNSARHSRAGYMARLAELGWTHTEVGALVGITKQRVQKVIKGRRMGQPTLPTSADDGGQSE